MHSFTATAGAINSGLKKLARLTHAGFQRNPFRLYRGLSNLAFEDRLLISRERQEQEGVELMVLQRYVHMLDGATLRDALRESPGLLGPGQDGNFLGEQVTSLTGRDQRSHL